eukprot:Sspe_Gene.55930::Locus_30768_Transcript_1_2_Confidence_0.667_Length_515::g.55930::m.55930
MTVRACTATALLALLAVAGGVDLHPQNFESEVHGDKNAFVLFFAPWCGHCKRLAPAWEQLMAHYASSPHVLVGRVDCTKHRDLCAMNEIMGYPTMLAYKPKADAEEYDGGRSFEELQQFVEANLVPAKK